MAVTYRLVQVLSGHGCFGDYLHQIGREETAACQHCGADRDTAQHTLKECPAWDTQRRALVQVVGGDLSLPAIVSCMVGDGGSWRAVSSFCEQVMLQKEEAERVREADPEAPPNRRRRGGPQTGARAPARLTRAGAGELSLPCAVALCPLPLLAGVPP